MDISRLNWFLGVFAIEVWLVAWFLAYEGEIRLWWKRRAYYARMRRLQAAEMAMPPQSSEIATVPPARKRQARAA
jgi:hypothetical protein